jgi:uncharacterized protein
MERVTIPSRREFLAQMATALAAYAFPPWCTLSPAGRLRPGAIRSVYVPMRDGVRIALDIVLPVGAAGGQRFPTALTMTRYWRSAVGAGPDADEQLFASHGFAVVAGDVRGTGASGGVWPHHRARAETLDFGEVIDWIARQAWSNGSVIGFGNSYAGNTADWMPEQQRAALKAIVPRFPDFDPYADLYFPGGVPNAYMGRNWGLKVKDLDLNKGINKGIGVRPVDSDTNGADLARTVAARRDVPSVWESLREITFRDDRPPAWHGESMDDWGIHAHVAAVEASRTPIQTWAGWMDAGTAAGAIHRFMTLTNPLRVFIGAFSHGGVHNASPYRTADDPANPPFATQLAEDLCFLHRCLDGPRLQMGDKQLAYYTMGEERWKTTRQWPPDGFHHAPWYLGAGRRLTTDAHAPPGTDIYQVDFTATTGRANRWATNNGGAPVDYGDRAGADSKLLTYTTRPVPHDLEITGTPVVHLWITSTHDDGNVFVYLEDVAPDGVVRYITEGELRAIHRKVSTAPSPYPIRGPYHTFARADAEPLVPGQIAELAFALMPVSVRIRRGHSVRVAIAGADADTFTRVPASGDPTVTVLWGPQHPSRIELPVGNVGRV